MEKVPFEAVDNLLCEGSKWEFSQRPGKSQSADRNHEASLVEATGFSLSLSAAQFVLSVRKFIFACNCFTISVFVCIDRSLQLFLCHAIEIESRFDKRTDFSKVSPTRQHLHVNDSIMRLTEDSKVIKAIKRCVYILFAPVDSRGTLRWLASR